MRIDSPNLVGATTITGSASITGSITPGLDSFYNFGSLSKKWNNIYAASFSGSLTQLADGSPYLIAGSSINLITGSGGAVTISLFSGTPNYLARYTSSMLADSIIYDSGQRIGIGVIPTAERCFISGSATGTTLQVRSGGGETVFNVQNTVGDSLLSVSGNGNVGIGTTVSSDMLAVNGAVSVSGSILPGLDVTYSLGSSLKRWANIFTGDLHLKNERGDWTIIEEELCLTIRNNKTGKRYMINMTPIPALDESLGKFSAGPRQNL